MKHSNGPLGIFHHSILNPLTWPSQPSLANANPESGAKKFKLNPVEAKSTQLNGRDNKIGHSSRSSSNQRSKETADQRCLLITILENGQKTNRQTHKKKKIQKEKMKKRKEDQKEKKRKNEKNERKEEK